MLHGSACRLRRRVRGLRRRLCWRAPKPPRRLKSKNHYHQKSDYNRDSCSKKFVYNLGCNTHPHLARELLELCPALCVRLTTACALMR